MPEPTSMTCPQSGHSSKPVTDSARKWRICAFTLGLLFSGSVLAGVGMAVAWCRDQETQAKTYSEAMAKLEAKAKEEKLASANKTFAIIGHEIEASKPVERVTLLVAKSNMTLYTALRGKPDIFFTEKSFPKEDAPKDALTPNDLPTLKGKFLKRSLRKGDHVTLDDVLDGTHTVQSMLDDKRAVAIRTKTDTIPDGIANLPGRHVDVIWIFRSGDPEQVMSRILVENVTVLAPCYEEKDGKSGVVVVTLALSPEDAAMVAVALETGSLHLLVRPLENDRTGK